MLSFKDLTEKKKTNVLINPKKKDITEKNHGEDCDCMKCEEKRRKEDVNDGPDIATEESCGKGMYYCNTDQKCKPIPEGYKEDKDGMLVKEAKVDQGKDDAAKQNERNQRMFGNRRGSKGSIKHSDDTEARRYNTEKGRGVKMKGKKDKTPVNYHKQDSQKRVDALLGKMRKEDVSAKDRFKRDAGAIAKKKMRNKEHRKYVNFLDVDENTIHSFNTFIQNNKPYDSQKEVSEESDKESKVETSLLKFSECWKTHKKVGMKMKGGKLVNDCRPKNEEVEVVNEVSDKLKKSYIKGATKDIEKLRKTGKTPSGELDTPSADKVLKRKINIGKTMATMKKEEVELDEKVYTGPDKKDRAVIKKMDNPSYAKKLADYEKNMDPKKRQAPKDKATKGMKFTHEGRDLALDAIRAKYKDQIMKRGQPKKVKGAKSTVGTGKYKKMADQKKQTAADAKKRGFKSTQNYVDTMARYGGKDNYDKGKGLGT